MSNENLAAREPLLMMAENNNNGDINGNSNMEDNNNLMVNRNVVAAAAGEPGRGLGPTPPLETSTPSPPANYHPGLNRTRYSDTTSSTETEEEDEERGRL
jgi:hypothetical protein